MDNPSPSAGAASVAPERALKPPASARARLLIAVISGGALAAAFAPVNLWPLALLCPAVLLWLCQDASPREAARLGFGFTTATFIAGTYWLYFSVHILGQAPIWLALVLMIGLAGDHGPLPGRARLRARALAARGRTGALADRGSGGVAADGMVARLVPVGIFLAVARLFADRQLAGRLRPARWACTA